MHLLQVGRLLVGATLFAFTGCSAAQPTDPVKPDTWKSLATPQAVVEFTAPDEPSASRYLAMASAAVLNLEQFFSAHYTRTPTVRVYAERDSLVLYWRALFNSPSFVPECWMIATGGADRIVMLSPRQWLTKACSNTPDSVGVQRVIAHELVHMLHLQTTPALDRVGMQWFMEGLAYVVAGQYTAPARSQVASQVRAGLQLTRLEDAWTSVNPYPVCASLADYIQRTYGQATLAALLSVKSKAELLQRLNLTEAALLANWRAELL